jgi:glycosyltransferase involved in cell wall biosynthesis
VGRTVRRAARILTGSEFSRKSILKVYGDLDEDQVVVVPDAAASEFRPISREAASANVRGTVFDSRAVYSFGGRPATAQEPYRADPGLCAAGARLPATEAHLVLVGKETWFAEGVHQAARESGVAERIHFFGFVSDPDLLQLYNACDLLRVSVVLRRLRAAGAGSHGVRTRGGVFHALVAAGSGGRRGHPVRPVHGGRVRARDRRLLLDSELRGRMERLGLQRAAHFSWQKTAQRTLEVFHEVAERSRAADERVGFSGP